MSFFDKIFGGKEETPERKSFWKKIESSEDLSQAIEASYHHRIAIFKHSTRCFISTTVLKNFEKEIDGLNDKPDLYYLDLLEHRLISNKIADDLGIRHESPQLIIIEDGKVVDSSSHEDISVRQIV